MVIIKNTYSVYLHVFPDYKKYVGSTSLPLRIRWDGGLGYMHQKRMFSAILHYGWENVKHYVLFEGLSKKQAEIIEAALIRDWKTTMRGKGYNKVQPKIDGLSGFEVPEFTKRQIVDTWDECIERRYKKLLEGHGCKSKGCKPVRLVETGEIFASVTAAARAMLVTPSSISAAVRNPKNTCGICWIEDKDDGWRMEVPAHWEYINTNIEEKDDEHD